MTQRRDPPSLRWVRGKSKNHTDVSNHWKLGTVYYHSRTLPIQMGLCINTHGVSTNPEGRSHRAKEHTQLPPQGGGEGGQKAGSISQVTPGALSHQDSEI